MMWSRFADALNHYGSDFEYIEVPWIVSKQSMEFTCPPGGNYFEIKDERKGQSQGYLVASAEQSFLEMLTKDKLKMNARYMAISPCFRVEDDYWHKPYFMKLELIWTCQRDQCEGDLSFTVRKATDFFSKYIDVEVVPMEPTNKIGIQSFDIVTKGTNIELGSYGVRRYPAGCFWVYGTGLAEPRLSMAMDHNQGNPADL